MKRFLIPLLSACLLASLPSCKTERTVYDEYGRPVQESQPGQERDIQEVMEGRFDAAFSERRNKDGVPESASSRVSRYQKDIDAARSGGKTFHTNSYNGFNRTSDIRSKSFAGSGQTSDIRSKSFNAGRSSSVDRNLRPDFLNRSHGLAHESYQGPQGRSDMEGRSSDASGHTYSTRASDYKRSTTSSYVQSRQSKTPQPKIIDHRNQGSSKSINETRHLLGRDEQPQ